MRPPLGLLRQSAGSTPPGRVLKDVLVVALQGKSRAGRPSPGFNPGIIRLTSTEFSLDSVAGG